MRKAVKGAVIAGVALVVAMLALDRLVPDWRLTLGSSSDRPAAGAPETVQSTETAGAETETAPETAAVPSDPSAPTDGTSAAAANAARDGEAAEVGPADGSADESAPAEQLAAAPPAGETPAEPEAAGPDALAEEGTSEDEPAEEAEAPPADPDAPTVDVVRVDSGGETVIAGRTRPGAEIEVLLDGEVIASATADGRGEFVAIASLGTSPDARAIQLRTLRPETGAESAEPAAPAGSGTDAVPLASVVAVMPADAAEGEDAAAGADGAVPATSYALSAPIVVLPSAGEEGAPVLVQPGREDVALLQPALKPGARVVLDRITYAAGGDAVAAGRGQPDHVVRAYANARLVGEVPVAEDGTWTVTLPRAVAEATQLLRFDEIARTGEVTSRIETGFTYADGAGAQELRQRSIVVERGDNLWRIAEQFYGEGLRYSVIYGANASQIRDPDLIYPDQVFTIPELVTAE